VRSKGPTPTFEEVHLDSVHEQTVQAQTGVGDTRHVAKATDYSDPASVVFPVDKPGR